MKNTSKKLIAGAGLAGSLIFGGITVANAQTTPAAPVAGIALSSPRPDPSIRMQSTLKPLVTAGTITQAQADAVVKVIVAAEPAGGARGGPGGRGPGGPGGGRGPHSDTVATALGITTTELRTQLQAGQTVAQIAGAKGVDVQKVIAAFVAEEKVEHRDVSDAAVTARVTDRVNGVRPTPPTDASAPAEA